MLEGACLKNPWSVLPNPTCWLMGCGSMTMCSHISTVCPLTRTLSSDLGSQICLGFSGIRKPR